MVCNSHPMEPDKGNEPCFIRLYVGGLGPSVTRTDLESTFSSLGKVSSVDMVRTKGRNFAYISFETVHPRDLQRFFSRYNGCMWKGGRLKLEKAKELYLDKLSHEWADRDHSAKELALHTTESQSGCMLPKFETSEGFNIFFPKLRKVKKIPMNGLGKHKRSFQRVDALPCSLLQVCNCNECCRSSSINQGISTAGQVESIQKNEGTSLQPDRMRIPAKKLKRIEETSFKRPVENSTESPKMHKETNCLNDVEVAAGWSGGVAQVKELFMKETEDAGMKVDHVVQNRTHDMEETQENVNELMQKACRCAYIPTKQGTEVCFPMEEREGSPKTCEPEKIEEEKAQVNVATQSSAGTVWIQKASWKSLVGEKGRFSFTLGNILGERLDSPTVGTEQMTDVKPLAGPSSAHEQSASMALELKLESQKRTLPSTDNDMVQKNSVAHPRIPTTGSRGNTLTQIKVTPPQVIENHKGLQDGTPSNKLTVMQSTNPSISSSKVDGNDKVCMFMKSANSEQEWLESKWIVKDLVKRRRKDALRGIKMLHRPKQHD